ncbi:hypothetical protein [Vibrio sp. YIC-376]
MIQNLFTEYFIANVAPNAYQQSGIRFLVSLKLAGMTVVKEN